MIRYGGPNCALLFHKRNTIQIYNFQAACIFRRLGTSRPIGAVSGVKSSDFGDTVRLIYHKQPEIASICDGLCCRNNLDMLRVKPGFRDDDILNN